MLAAAVISFMVLIILFEGLGLRRSFDAAFGRFRSGPIRRLALASFRWRYVTVSLAVSLLLVSAGMFSGGFVKFRFFPSPEAENITATVIFAAGTGNPFFSTDTTAALRASEIAADVILKATKVDGVYDKDPMKHADAQRFEHLTFTDALTLGLKVMDATAFSLCRDNNKPIIVFDMTNPENIGRVLTGEPIGTVVSAKPIEPAADDASAA